MNSGYKTRLPEWTWTTQLDELPPSLHWHGNDDVPPVGAQVMVDSHGDHQDEDSRFDVEQDGSGDTGVVAGYSHENGNLRVVVFQDNPAEELQTPNGYYPVHLLGSYVYRIGFLGDSDLPKPSLHHIQLDFLTKAAQVAASAELALVAARAATRAAERAFAYAHAAYRDTLPPPLRDPSEFEGNELPF